MLNLSVDHLHWCARG